MPNPTPGDMHVDRYLTDLAVSWAQDQNNFVANRVFPVVPVKKQSDLFVIYDRSFFYRDEMQERPLGGEAKEAGYGISQGTYRCTEDAVAHKIDDRTRANADQPLDPDRSAMRFLTTQAMIHQDRDWAASYFGTGIWGQTDQAGVASGPSTNQFLQFDQSGSKPIQVVRARLSAVGGSTGFRPNVGVLGSDVFDTLVNHPDIVDRMKYTSSEVADEAILARLLGLERIVVPRGIQNTAKEGLTASYSWIANSKSMLLAYAPAQASIDTPSAGYTFAWTDLIPGATNAFGGVIERMRDPKAHSDYFDIRVASDQKAVATELGQFFSAAVA